jgi:CRP-like cAMP-binding protein
MKYKAFLEKVVGISPLSEESQEAFSNIVEAFSFKKNEVILENGQISNHVFYIEQGLVRMFYHKHDKEITEWIALEDEFFISIGSFYRRTPSHLIQQAVEKSDIIGIPHDAFMELCAKYHDIETLHRTMITQSLLLSQERVDSIQFETAHQRYDALIAKNPKIIQRVSLTYIASFLGITLETLSRIRAKTN